MKVDATVVDIQVKMGEKRSKLDPSVTTTAPVWQVVCQSVGTDMTIQVGISTMDPAKGEKFHIGQIVEVQIWPKNLRVAIEQLPIEGAEGTDAE
jgi:hypothetical protein